VRALGNGFIATLAVAAALLTGVGASPSIVRIASALSLVLVLPGLSLTRMLFPARALGGGEVLLLSIALSLCTTVVGGLALHVSLVDLTRGSWAAFLAGVTVVAVIIAEARMRRMERVVIDRPHRSTDRIRSAPAVRGRWLVNGALFGLALGVGISAVLMARTPLPARGVEGYTALWLLPGDKAGRKLEVGVRSSEFRTTRYRLEVRVGGTRVPPYRFQLTTGGSWNASLRVRRGWKGTVRALLYRASAPDKVYRRARLLVDLSKGSGSR
jgi:uncharacterized membrane protein